MVDYSTDEPKPEVLDRVFSALADPIRRAILTRLDGEDLLVSDLAEPFDVSLQAVSKHIQVLVRAGLVVQERTGRISRCRLDAGPIYQAAVWINRYMKYWQAQLTRWRSGSTKSNAPILNRRPIQRNAKRHGNLMSTRRKKIQSIHQSGENQSMPYPDTTAKLRDYRTQIAGLREKMRDLQKKIEPQEVKNYQFSTPEGTVSLADLFGDKEYLFVVHNMGASCPYCTLWADGFNGIVPHLESRAAFVVSSPDAPAAQNKFKTGRGWKFRMVSHEGTTFAADMGYFNSDGMQPGVSVFKKSGNKILRVSDAEFGPGDDFSIPWHLFDLIPEGAAGWEPKYRY